ncbi:hypothetical protein Halru_3156 [Halovivax ruber XH-70]|uniref:Uncharacterized protein n=1 Tax=Halovivax ruber (strain DSM 18193 / JCM 13892 / XH-70) TaxID=797302 RepID=L0IIB8_HALRX|nr:hypothetical protein Halru_3156 [Halovivax ruber XH-70]
MPPGRDDSFRGLASELRLGLVAILAASDAPLSYSTILDRSPVDDGGRLNYHLRQLTGTFVRKSSAGYELTQQGRWAHNLLVADVLNDEVERDPVVIDSVCGRCANPTVEISYRAGEGVVECPACEHVLSAFDFPPGPADSLSTAAFVAAYANRTRAYVDLADDGVCPFCAHRMTSTVDSWAERRPDAPSVRFDCAGCGATVYAPVGLVLSTRPRIASTLFDHGAALDTTPFWEYEWAVFSAPTVSQQEPLRISLTITVADVEWRVVVNGDASIVDCQPSM